MVFSENFTLNGVTGESQDVYIVTFDNSVLTSVGVPFSRDISSIDGFSQINPMYKDEDVEPDDIVLNFMYIKDNMAMEWTSEKLIEIKKWMITDDFIPFISQDNPDYIYYLKCKKIENKMTPNMEGVLEVTFKPFSHFAYKRFSSKLTVTSPKSTLIENPSID